MRLERSSLLFSFNEDIGSCSADYCNFWTGYSTGLNDIFIIIFFLWVVVVALSPLFYDRDYPLGLFPEGERGEW